MAGEGLAGCQLFYLGRTHVAFFSGLRFYLNRIQALYLVFKALQSSLPSQISSSCCPGPRPRDLPSVLQAQQAPAASGPLHLFPLPNVLNLDLCVTADQVSVPDHLFRDPFPGSPL